MEKDWKEILFGAKGIELLGWEYAIPEGYTAEIKDGKIIVKQLEQKPAQTSDEKEYARTAKNTGGIQVEFVSVSALPTGASLTAEAKAKRYYLTADDSDAGFAKGDVVEWRTDSDGWVNY